MRPHSLTSPTAMKSWKIVSCWYFLLARSVITFAVDASGLAKTDEHRRLPAMMKMKMMHHGGKGGGKGRSMKSHKKMKSMAKSSKKGSSKHEYSKPTHKGKGATPKPVPSPVPPTMQPSTLSSPPPSLRPSEKPTPLQALSPTLTPTASNSGDAPSLDPSGTWTPLGQVLEFPFNDGASDVPIALSANGRIVATASRFEPDGVVYVHAYDDVTATWRTVLLLDISPRDVALSADGTRLAMTSSENLVRVYEFDGNNFWTPLGQEIALPAPQEWPVAISGDGSTIVVGGTATDEYYDSGPVRVYRYNPDTAVWDPFGNDIVPPGDRDDYNASVDISHDGTVIALGFPFTYLESTPGGGILLDGTGRVRVYSYTAGSWLQRGQDIVGQTVNDDAAGVDVALAADGSTVVLGAYQGGERGQARVYDFDFPNNMWIQRGANIDGLGASTFDWGANVASSANANVAAFAAYGNGGVTEEGHVVVFQYDSGQWSQIGQTLLDGEITREIGPYFVSVALSAAGNTLAAASYDGIPGMIVARVRVYTYS